MRARIVFIAILAILFLAARAGAADAPRPGGGAVLRIRVNVVAMVSAPLPPTASFLQAVAPDSLTVRLSDGPTPAGVNRYTELSSLGDSVWSQQVGEEYGAACRVVAPEAEGPRVLSTAVQLQAPAGCDAQLLTTVVVPD